MLGIGAVMALAWRPRGPGSLQASHRLQKRVGNFWRDGVASEQLKGWTGPSSFRVGRSVVLGLCRAYLLCAQCVGTRKNCEGTVADFKKPIVQLGRPNQTTKRLESYTDVAA